MSVKENILKSTLLWGGRLYRTSEFVMCIFVEETEAVFLLMKHDKNVQRPDVLTGNSKTITSAPPDINGTSTFQKIYPSL